MLLGRLEIEGKILFFQRLGTDVDNGKALCSEAKIVHANAGLDVLFPSWPRVGNTAHACMFLGHLEVEGKKDSSFKDLAQM